MGWMLVVFDLPVTTKELQKEAVGFRKFLLDEGYLMIQYSVYARACVSYNRMQTQMRRLVQNIPREGHIRALYVTQAQWERMFVINGAPNKRVPPEDFPEQLLLW